VYLIELNESLTNPYCKIYIKNYIYKSVFTNLQEMKIKYEELIQIANMSKEFEED
jgi:hypothetical protein